MPIKHKTPKRSNPSASSYSVARTQRKWRIRGVTADGGRLAFSVLAFDHREAGKIAEKKAHGGQITDIVLFD
jgi:predicted ester cyclase